MKKLTFICFFSGNDAWMALSQEEREKKFAEIMKKQKELREKLGVNEFFWAHPLGVSETGVYACEADSIDIFNEYMSQSVGGWITGRRTIVCYQNPLYVKYSGR